MALFEQVGNYVKLRTTTLPETANQEDWERIHITDFSSRTTGTDTIAFMDDDRTVLVISGEVEAQAFYADTMANLIDDVDDFIESLQETGSGGPGGSGSTVVKLVVASGSFSGSVYTNAALIGKTLMVFSGGVLLDAGTDYTFNSGTGALTFASAQDIVIQYW